MPFSEGIFDRIQSHEKQKAFEGSEFLEGAKEQHFSVQVIFQRGEIGIFMQCNIRPVLKIYLQSMAVAQKLLTLAWLGLLVKVKK